MARRFRLLALIGLSLTPLFIARHGAATSIAPVKLDDLFRRSTVVATVHFLSADAEFYPEGVCKTRVNNAYKGTETGAVLYISPCLTYEIGSDYLLFLDPEYKENAHPQNADSPYPAMKSAFRVADAGYGRMLIEYACIFEGRIASDSCDYGVKLNPEQIILPARLKAFPKSEATAETNYYRWVLKSELETYLSRLVADSRVAK
jgi:hypothetical protein